ncbi:MAG: hypothetical protein HY975_03645 [Candidatus Kerfeldbacteria bacterium]|nr:hypothetical protein [Candidatus Kerfeldbacteria bacterium]
MGIITHRSIGTAAVQTLPMVWLDIETTGYDRQSGGEICEIGVYKVDPQSLQPLAQLDLKLRVENPRKRTEDELSFNHYNGFSFAEWRDALPPREAITQLNDFCAGVSLWGWNVSYELLWLSSYYEEYQLDWRGDYHWLCLMSAANFILRPEFASGAIPKLSLSHVGTFFGLPPEPNPHRGLTGARYEHAVYEQLRKYQDSR